MMRGRLSAGPALANLARSFQAVHLRHLHVQEKHVVGFLLERLEDFEPVVGDIGAVAELVEHAQADFLVDRIVIGQQQSQRQTAGEVGVERRGGRGLFLALELDAQGAAQAHRATGPGGWVCGRRRKCRASQARGSSPRKRAPRTAAAAAGSARWAACGSRRPAPGRRVSGNCRSRMTASNGAASASSVERLAAVWAQSRRSCPIARPRCAMMRRLVALSSMTSRRLPANCGCGACQAGGAVGGDAWAEMVKWKVAPLPASLSTQIFPPSNSVSRLQIARPKPGAAVVAGGRGIHLLERLEQPVLLVERDADAGVAHGEMQQPLLGMPQKIRVMFVARRDAAWRRARRR